MSCVICTVSCMRIICRPTLGHIQNKLVGDHNFCFKEVGRAGGVFFFCLFSCFLKNWYECGGEDKYFIILEREQWRIWGGGGRPPA